MVERMVQRILKGNIGQAGHSHMARSAQDAHTQHAQDAHVAYDDLAVEVAVHLVDSFESPFLRI
jgi:hypothetical protein